jgi:glycosyltransferase involved in cell wall biosynthesis
VKIIVASTFVPFIRGGGVQIVDELVLALRERGHEVDTVMLPFHSNPAEMVEQMLALRMLDLSDAGDRLIAIRTPSYILEHPNKVLWFIHHHRGAYDLWGTEFGDIPNTAEGRRLRSLIVAADDRYLPEAKRIYTNSQVVSDRLREFSRLDSEVLYPPLWKTDGYHCDGYGDYVFYPSRITTGKRQGLLVEAMAHVKTGVRAVIAGSPDHPRELDYLRQVIEREGVEDRVDLIAGWLPQERKEELMAGSLACVYIPFDEDSYGYVSLEAYHSYKPVVTCSDSGGTLEIVEDRVTGRVAEPEAAALAEALDDLYSARADAERMGRAGFERMGQLGISWDHIVDELTR